MLIVWWIHTIKKVLLYYLLSGLVLIWVYCLFWTRRSSMLNYISCSFIYLLRDVLSLSTFFWYFKFVSPFRLLTNASTSSLLLLTAILYWLWELGLLDPLWSNRTYFRLERRLSLVLAFSFVPNIICFFIRLQILITLLTVLWLILWATLWWALYLLFHTLKLGPVSPLRFLCRLNLFLRTLIWVWVWFSLFS